MNINIIFTYIFSTFEGFENETSKPPHPRNKDERFRPTSQPFLAWGEHFSSLFRGRGGNLQLSRAEKIFFRKNFFRDGHDHIQNFAKKFKSEKSQNSRVPEIFKRPKTPPRRAWKFYGAVLEFFGAPLKFLSAPKIFYPPWNTVFSFYVAL